MFRALVSNIMSILDILKAPVYCTTEKKHRPEIITLNKYICLCQASSCSLSLVAIRKIFWPICALSICHRMLCSPCVIACECCITAIHSPAAPHCVGNEAFRCVAQTHVSNLKCLSSAFLKHFLSL